MLNRVFIIGNLGKDPEMRSLPSGQAVAEFSVASRRRWKDRDGNPQEETEWHRVVCFGRQGEIAGQYLRKGKQVFVEGRLRTRSWDDQQSGQKRYMTEIVCENFQMLGSRSDGDGGGRGPSDDYGTGGGGGRGGDYGGGGGGGRGDSGPPSDAGDDDIPF